MHGERPKVFYDSLNLVLQWGPDYYITSNFQIYVLVCAAQITKSMTTNNIPLKSPIKLQKEMQKKFWIFQNLLVFRAFFKKLVFWENGRGRHQMGATLIHYTSIFNESQWGSPHESFIQKYWLVSNLPVFQKNIAFSKNGLKTNNFWKNDFFSFLIAIL